MTEQISTADWQEKVLDAKGPVFVDFFATWCGPCRMTSPIVEEIAAEKAGTVAVYKIDVDESPQIAQMYRIDSIPTFIMFRDGKPVAQLIGARPKQDILRLFEA